MKILIKGTNWIGDAVMSTPAMRALREAFPNAYIALHTPSWAEKVFNECYYLDEVISYDRGRGQFRTPIEQGRGLRARKFDVAILFPNSFASALTAIIAGIPKRIGYGTDGRRLLLTHSEPVPDWKSDRHESEFYLNLVRSAIERLDGPSQTSKLEPLIDVSEERRNLARELLISSGVGANGPIIAIGAGSTNSLAKRWPVESYAQLLDYFKLRLGAGIVLVGSADESDIGLALERSSRARPLNLVGATDLGMATAILAVANLFVSNDMGLAHISAAVGTPTLTIFGPTNESATAPIGPNARYIREVVECSPCMLRHCPIDHRCMKRMTADRVFEAAETMLNEIKG